MAILAYKGNNEEFKKACEAAKLPLTKRQFKKFEKGQGTAYKYHLELKRTERDMVPLTK